MKPGEINDKLEIPEDIKYVSIKEDEAEFLFEFIREHKLEKSLETGLGFGRSAVHILAAHGKKHIAIDPFQSDYKHLALKNIESLGLQENFEFIEDYSHNALPSLNQQNLKFDFIFIDGDHTFDGILVDFYYADLLLENKGFIFFHDTWMRSTQLAASFIRKNKSNYKTIKSPLRNFLIFQKQSGDDRRNGMHFREFYTNRSRIKFALISWLLKPGDSFLKKTAIKMKNLLK